MGGTGHFALGGVQNSYSFPYAAAGRIVVGATAVRLPNIPCEQVFFRVPSSNTQTVYIGGQDVSSALGMPFLAGEFSPWIPIQNLNELYTIAGGAGQVLYYFIVR